MLKKLILENWKSFRYAELPIDPLTILIGTNASGKSNAVDALDFLNRVTHGENVQTCLVGAPIMPAIRGGTEWVVFKPKSQCTLKIVVSGENDRTDYLYSITIQTTPSIEIVDEFLVRLRKRLNTSKSFYQTTLFRAQIADDKIGNECVSLELHKVKTPMHIEYDTPRSVLPLLALSTFLRKEIIQGISAVFKALSNIFILDPIPSKMRSYSLISDNLQRDASNIAGVLAALPKDQKLEVESVLSEYMTHLPERDIKRVWAEVVGRLDSDAMLYCEESWISEQSPMVIDARGMSDGSLRFLGILTALLTRPEGSQLVIEEVDNGLHPSRADLLLKMLREIGEQRQIDILVTTHNPALLNALEPEMLPFVIVAHRDSQTGESKLTPIEDLENLPKLMASGPLGKLAEQGSIERSLSGT